MCFARSCGQGANAKNVMRSLKPRRNDMGKFILAIAIFIVAFALGCAVGKR